MHTILASLSFDTSDRKTAEPLVACLQELRVGSAHKYNHVLLVNGCVVKSINYW